MNTLMVIAPQTGAINTALIANSVDASNYPSLTVCADALGVGETVGIYILCGNTFNAMTDSLGNVQQLKGGAAGTAIPAIQLVGGNVYAITKSATASAVGVYVQFVGRFV